jgi:uncharacterized protein YegP (UPF0339 family)
MAKFEVYKDRVANYRWRFRASNGRIVADSSEGYVNKSDCLTGIAIVKKEAPAAPIDDQTQQSAYGQRW